MKSSPPPKHEVFLIVFYVKFPVNVKLFQMMSVSHLFNTYLGMYVAQSFCHSLVTAIIVTSAIEAWGIRDPVFRQRLRFMTILLPVVSFPLYQAINPGRGSMTFRLESLFDVNRWLLLEVAGIPLGTVFVLILAVTSVGFVVQEFFPVIRQTFFLKERFLLFEATTPEAGSDVMKAMESLPAGDYAIRVIEEEDFVLFSKVGKRPEIFLSRGLVEALEPGQLRAAIAHEAAHIARSRRPILIAAFLLRGLMFFNPVVMIVFRQIVEEEEKICDDMAVLAAGSAGVLAETLGKFYYTRGVEEEKDKDPPAGGRLSRLRATLHDYTHNLHLEKRIGRLKAGGRRQEAKGEWGRLLAMLVSMLALNYCIV